jgi:hypothetical protein
MTIIVNTTVTRNGDKYDVAVEADYDVDGYGRIDVNFLGAEWDGHPSTGPDDAPGVLTSLECADLKLWVERGDGYDLVYEIALDNQTFERSR